MELTVLGSAGSRASRRNPASGYLVENGPDRVLLDAGTGSFMALVELADPSDLGALVISHMHVDHSIDLLSIYQHLSHAGPPARAIPVYAPKNASHRYGAFLGAESDHKLYRAFDFVDALSEGNARVGSIGLTFAPVIHSVEAVATRLDADGGSLVYSGDTGPTDTLIDLARDADVLLCEASLQDDSPTYAFHLSARQAGEIAAGAAVGRLILTHLPPTLDPVRSVREATAAFGRTVEVAAPGTRTSIRPNDRGGV